jgi:hypothetical protein
MQAGGLMVESIRIDPREEGEGMRKAFFIAIAALVVVVGLMPATAASAGAARRYYEGTTSEGGRLSISVIVRHGVPYLGVLVIDGPYSCEDGTHGDIAGGGFGWSPSDLAGPVPTNEPFELSENGRDFAFTVSGRLGTFRGSGMLTVLMPALTADEHAAQVCTFGGTWSVERFDTSISLKPAVAVETERGRTLAMGFRVAGSRDSTTLAQTAAGQIRHYRGGTTQDTAMVLRTSWTDTGIALLYMTVGSSLACEDGTEFGGTIFAHAFFDTTQVMPPGRLDLDILPDAFPLGIALHVHGELDAHLGSGTVSMIWPRLTEDVRAQRCQTGEQTWRLWRTDAGF